MQSNPNRISSNPLIVGREDHLEFKLTHRTPNGRMFSCCDKVGAPNGCKHGRYFLPKKRWDKSRRDHN